MTYTSSNELMAIVVGCALFVNNKDGIDLIDAIINLLVRL